MLSLSNDKLGFYTVGPKKFHSKILALLESTTCGNFPEWNFNQDRFNSVTWTQEPVQDLLDLYKQRAQQLREKYDYIRLEFSGGADSTTVLYSFVNNGIHLDEIVFNYPQSGTHGIQTADPFNTKCENALSEFEYAAKPILNWVQSNFPKIKITMRDYVDDMVNNNLNENWLLRTRDYCQPTHAFKHSATSSKNYKILADQGKKICVLYGIDKPKICIKEKKWYLYFIDFQANHANTDVDIYTNIDIEYFYWTPDLPEILAKQAHLIKNWFQLSHNKFLQYLVRWPNHSQSHRTTYEHLVKSVIYPDYDPATFQVSKPTSHFYTEMDYWFFKNMTETQAYKNWQAGLNYVKNNIDPKFFNTENDQPTGFVGFLSPFYYIGDADYQDTGINNFLKF
jgi:hypothetical protein